MAKREHDAGLAGGKAVVSRGLEHFGVVDWFTLDEHHCVDQLIARLCDAKIPLLRVGVSWADYHTPTGRGWYDWLLPRLAGELSILPCVTYTPPSLGLEPDTASPPRRPRDYADFLDLFVDRYGDLFDWIELWNEPNNLNDWNWHLDHEWHLFSQMVGDAAYWMKQRGKRTVLGGMCPTDPNWLSLMCQRGVMDCIDAVGIHAFPETWTPHWKGWEHELSGTRKVLHQHGVKAQLWITEAGYSSWRNDEPEQIRHFLELLDAPADRVYWYSLRDLDENRASQEGFHFDERHYHTGLIRTDGTPKLLLRTLQDEGLSAARRIATWQQRRPHRIRGDVALVTGGAGFVGANVASRLAGEGRRVLVYDSLARPGVTQNIAWLKQHHGDLIEIEIGDIRDRHRLRRAVDWASCVFHFAAQVAVTTSLSDPLQDFEVNAAGTLGLLEAVRNRREPPPLIMASTNKLYGHGITPAALEERSDCYAVGTPAGKLGIDESHAIELVSPYGCSKGAADQYVLDYARTFGIPTAVFRMSCIYGPRQFGTVDQGWVAHFLDTAIRRRPLTIYGNGKQVRDILYVDDAVDAYLLALRNIEATRGEVFNLGGGPGNAISLLQLLELIEELQGEMPAVHFDAWRPGDQRYYVTDTRKFERATAWQPKVPARMGVERLHRWLYRFLKASPIEHHQEERLSA